MATAEQAEQAEPRAWAVRPATREDFAFICSSWAQSYRSAPAVEGVHGAAYFDGQRERIDRALHYCRPLVACDPAHPDDIWGYVVAEPTRTHWVYVKAAFRRFGIGAALCRAEFLGSLPHTHDTLLGRHLAKKLSSPFNPFLAR